MTKKILLKYVKEKIAENRDAIEFLEQATIYHQDPERVAELRGEIDALENMARHFGLVSAFGIL